VHKNPLVPPDTIYVQPLSDTSISLYWKNVRVARKYRVYRSLSATGTFPVIKTVEDTSYLDEYLTDSTTYYYMISSIDSLNRESDRSSVFSATTFGLPASRWDHMVWDAGSWE
jgi:fibronectin type 3 domain-containing protein